MVHMAHMDHKCMGPQPPTHGELASPQISSRHTCLKPAKLRAKADKPEPAAPG